MSFETARKNWEKLAEQDALASVCTALYDKDQAWSEEEFFASGEREIQTVFAYLEEKGYRPERFERALDFGCGVGRLTRALGRRFASVQGVDVSAGMIEKARTLNQGYAPRISFTANPKGDLTQFPSNSFSFIYSVIVLQHIPYPQSLTYIQEMVRLLEPGGVFVFQVPITNSQSWFRRIRRRLVREIRGRLALAGITRRFFFEMNSLNAEEIGKAIQLGGGRILETLLTNHTEPKTYPAMLTLGAREAQGGFVSTLFIVRKT